jgi:hypothetical protein
MWQWEFLGRILVSVRGASRRGEKIKLWGHHTIGAVPPTSHLGIDPIFLLSTLR